MEGLMLHCGGTPATLTEIAEVKLPEIGTRPSKDVRRKGAEIVTYQPVGHKALAQRVAEITQDCLPVTLESEAYGLARNGQRMFGVLRFKNKGRSTNKEMGLTIGIANSYDKSMSAKIAAGASVFVCDNMVFAGDIQYARSHTRFVWDDIEAMIEGHILKGTTIYEEIVAEAALLKQVSLAPDEAYAAIGVMLGRKILLPQQASEAVRIWDTPRYKDFKERNVWSLYNSANEALKRTSPNKIMEKHIELHSFLTKEQEVFIN